MILSNIKCKKLWIDNQHLSRDTTESLVSAMRNNVKVVRLWDGVHLDIGALTAYSGQGRCRRVQCYGDTGRRYESQVETWARDIGWEFDKDASFDLIGLPY